jgi:hypothetical protein
MDTPPNDDVALLEMNEVVQNQELQTPAAKGSTKRKTVPLPPELMHITDANKDQFTSVLEIDKRKGSKNFGQDFLVASTVRVRKKMERRLLLFWRTSSWITFKK